MAEKLAFNEKVFFPYRRFTCTVVGAGGTGSYLVPNLARIISIVNSKYRLNHDIVLIDADEVEEKNLSRQNFVQGDIGKNKAEALARRYSKAFGVNISYIPEYLTESNAQILLQRTEHGCGILIGCVDNNKTRKIIHDFYRRNMDYIYLDSGNEEWGGQVVLSANSVYTRDGIHVRLNPAYAFGTVRINDVVEEFNLEPTDRHPSEMSCAERAVSAPQNIATNMKAADVLFGYLNKILVGAAEYVEGNLMRDTEKQNALLIGNHITYFDAINDQTKGIPFSEEVQDRIRKMRPR